MKVIALTSFVHGVLDMKPGDEAEFSDATAAELKATGLVRYAVKATSAESDASGESAKPVPRNASANKKAPEPKNKKAPEPENKGALQSFPDLDAETSAVAPDDQASPAPAKTEASE